MTTLAPASHDHPSADLCRRGRAALGLTQTQLAAVLGVHALTVSKWERGALVLPPRQVGILRAAAALPASEALYLGARVADALVAYGELVALRVLLDVVAPGGR